MMRKRVDADLCFLHVKKIMITVETARMKSAPSHEIKIINCVREGVRRAYTDCEIALSNCEIVLSISVSFVRSARKKVVIRIRNMPIRISANNTTVAFELNEKSISFFIRFLIETV